VVYIQTLLVQRLFGNTEARARARTLLVTLVAADGAAPPTTHALTLPKAGAPPGPRRAVCQCRARLAVLAADRLKHTQRSPRACKKHEHAAA